AFDLVRRSFDAVLAVAAPMLGENRARRIAGDDANGGVLLLEIAPRAGDGAARPRRRDEMRDAPRGLLPQLGTRRLVMRLRVGVVVKLVGQDCVRQLGCN